MASNVWYEITYPFQNLNGANVEVWEWVCNFTIRFKVEAMTYPCWD